MPPSQETGRGHRRRVRRRTIRPTRCSTFKLKGTYYYERKYGGTLAYFSTTGSADAGLYGTDADGNARTPNSNGYIVELDYLPIQNVRLMLQYTGYNKFDGAKIELRRQRPQRERQQHVVLQRVGGVLSRRAELPRDIAWPRRLHGRSLEPR